MMNNNEEFDIALDRYFEKCGYFGTTPDTPTAPTDTPCEEN